MRITFNLERGRERDAFGPLYNREFIIDPRDGGSVLVRDIHRDVNTRSMDQHHGIVMTFNARGLTRDTIAHLVRDSADVIRRIIAGHSVEWDGNNYVGRLTDDATEASWTLDRKIDDARFR